MSQQIILVKDTRQLVIQTVRVSGDTGGSGITTLEVANIDDPSVELNAIAGTLKGDLRLCFQKKDDRDDWTLYAWDDADSSAENVPYTVDGLAGSMWSAVAGRNHYDGIRGDGEFTAFGGSNKEISLGTTTIASASTGAVRADGLAVGTPISNLEVGAGFGHIVDIHTDPSNPVWTEVSWPAQTVAITDLTDFTVTFVFVDSTGTVQQQSTPPTSIQLRENIHLGFVAIFSGGIQNIVDDPYLAAGAAVQLSTLMDAIGSINLSVSVSNGGTDLSLALTGGQMHIRGISFDNTPAGRASPNTVTFPSLNPQGFFYQTQNISVIIEAFLIDPLNYDVAGVITVIPGSNNQAQNQRIWMFPDGQLGVQYGATLYSTLVNAVAGSATEAFVDNPIFATANAILLATLSIKKGATDLSDMDDARFLPGGKFGEASIGGSGQSVTSLQLAYNNSTDGTIITDVTRNAVKLQRGTALDTDDVLEVLNGAGAQTAGITGAGIATLLGLAIGGHTLVDTLISTDGSSTSDVALVTPGYVDARVVTDHGALTGLGDDDHTQYVLVDGTRAMSGNLTTTGIVLGGNAVTDTLISSDSPSSSDAAFITAGYADANLGGITDHGALTGLGDDDHTQYLLVDGTRAMSGILTGVGASHSRVGADATSVLVINKSPVSSQAGDGISITMGGNATGRGINIVNGGSGAAIRWDSGQSLAPDGTAGAPPYSFGGASNSGLYRSGGFVVLSVAGSGKVFAQAAGLLVGAAGTQSAGSIQILNSGSAIFQSATNELAISTAGTQAVRYDASQNQINAANIQLAQANRLILDTDLDTYIDANIDDRIRMVAGGIATAYFIAAEVQMRVPVTVQKNGIGTAETAGLSVFNATAAAAGAQQWSPLIVMEAQGWRTDATAETQEVLFATQVESVQGTANPSGDLVWKSNIDGAGYVDRMILNSAGDLTITGALNHDGTLVGLYGVTPVAQSAAYTLNATSVLDRTLLASASATTINNNNVIAALITDLQALGALG